MELNRANSVRNGLPELAQYKTCVQTFSYHFGNQMAPFSFKWLNRNGPEKARFRHVHWVMLLWKSIDTLGTAYVKVIGRLCGPGRGLSLCSSKNGA